MTSTSLCEASHWSLLILFTLHFKMSQGLLLIVLVGQLKRWSVQSLMCFTLCCKSLVFWNWTSFWNLKLNTIKLYRLNFVLRRMTIFKDMCVTNCLYILMHQCICHCRFVDAIIHKTKLSGAVPHRQWQWRQLRY